MTYSEKLRDPRWQKRRLQIMERDEFCCQFCYDSESSLCVHHRYYQGEPWEAPDEALVTLCEHCHAEETDRWSVEGKALLHQIKRHFSAGEVGHLSEGFHDAVLCHIPDVVVSAIVLALTDPEIQLALIERVFERNAKRAAQRA